MHELSMANNIIEIVMNESKKRKTSSVIEVDLVVGIFSMLGIEQLRYCYRLLTKDTPLEHSKLLIKQEEGRVRCGDCAFEGPMRLKEEKEYHLMFPTLECPKCGGVVEIVSGRDCYIKSIKLKGDTPNKA